MSTPYSQLTELLSLRFHVKHRKLSTQQDVARIGMGSHHAIRKGRGMEFSEVRAYQAGDDIRHIDWRVSARTQTTHTKLFTEELDKPILCVLQQTANLFFGSKKHFKLDQALQVASLIGWCTLNQSDKIGGLVFNNQQNHWIEPKHQKQSLMKLIHAGLDSQHAITKPQSTASFVWLKALKQLKKQARPGQKIYLIGDFLDWNTEEYQLLRQIKKHSDIVAIHIMDPLEASLPSTGFLKLSDGKKEFQFLASDQQTQDDFQACYQTLWQNCQQGFMQAKTPLVSISTHENPLESLISNRIIR